MEQFKNIVRSNPKTIIYPEGEDLRVLQAVAKLKGDGLLKEAILIGDSDKIHENAKSISLDEKSYTIRDVKGFIKNRKYREEYRIARNLSIIEDQKLQDDIHDPIIIGAILLRLGEVDGFIAGLQTSSAKVLATGINVIKPDKRIGVVTSFIIVYAGESNSRFKKMIGEGDVLLFADPVVKRDPSVGVLCKIAEATATYARSFLKLKPRIAFLSYSTKGSGEGKSVDKMRIAAKRASQKMPEAVIDGELQLDAAIIPSISNIKSPKSILEGKANILIFPNLDAANICTKSLYLFGEVKIIGPIIYGLNKPFNDISRGADESDVYDLSLITQLQTK